MVGIRQLRWRCRRGMRELDVLLVRYLETRYSEATPEEQAGFRALLELADPELFGLLLGRQEPPDERLARVVEQIRN